MSAMKTAILVALLFGLAWLLGCNHKDADEQQPSTSKAATGQQAAQPPPQTSEADEGEEGEEGAASPAAAAAEQPAPQQTAGKQFAYNFDGDTLGQLPAKFHSAKTGGGTAENGSCRLTQLLPQNRTLSLKLQRTKLTTVSLY